MGPDFPCHFRPGDLVSGDGVMPSFAFDAFLADHANRKCVGHIYCSSRVPVLDVRWSELEDRWSVRVLLPSGATGWILEPYLDLVQRLDETG